MKKFVAIALVASLFSCSKEADVLETAQAVQATREASSTDFFVVGLSNGTITYDQQDLEEICACAVGEDISGTLQIVQEFTNVYYLAGLATSSGSVTSFYVSLEEEGGELLWYDGAPIYTCQNDGSSPCDLQMVTENTHICDNGGAGTCEDGVFDEGNYRPCTNWPWAVTDKDKK